MLSFPRHASLRSYTFIGLLPAFPGRFHLEPQIGLKRTPVDRLAQAIEVAKLIVDGLCAKLLSLASTFKFIEDGLSRASRHPREVGGRQLSLILVETTGKDGRWAMGALRFAAC